MSDSDGNNSASNARARSNSNNNNPDPPPSSDDQTNIFFGAIRKNLPPVSTFYAFIQVSLYFLKFSGRFVTSEEDIDISWSKVVKEKQVWRLFVAHFFHFKIISVLANAAALIAMGRYMEKKFNTAAMFILIELMGVLSNILYLFISTFLCGNPADMTTHGFAHTHFALRMVQALSKDACRSGENQTLILGFIPLPIPSEWAPFEPAFQVILFDLIGRSCGNLTGHVSGIIAGLSCGALIKLFPNSLALYTEECTSIALVLPQNDGNIPQSSDLETLALLNPSDTNTLLQNRMSSGHDNWWIGNEDEVDDYDTFFAASASSPSNSPKDLTLDVLESQEQISSEDSSSDTSIVHETSSSSTSSTSSIVLPFF